MVLVLFLLFLGVVIFITFIILLTSILWIKIDIRNFKFYKEEKVHKKINDDYEVGVYLYIFKKIKLFEYKINKIKVSEKYFEKMKNKIDLSILKSFLKSNFDFSNAKFIELESLNLNLSLGTENVILTSGIVTFSNILISNLLSKLIINYDKEKYQYEVKPIYENRNKVYLLLDSKIKIKLFSFVKAFKSYNNSKEIILKKEKTLGI